MSLPSDSSTADPATDPTPSSGDAPGSNSNNYLIASSLKKNSSSLGSDTVPIRFLLTRYLTEPYRGPPDMSYTKAHHWRLVAGSPSKESLKDWDTFSRNLNGNMKRHLKSTICINGEVRPEQYPDVTDQIEITEREKLFREARAIFSDFFPAEGSGLSGSAATFELECVGIEQYLRRSPKISVDSLNPPPYDKVKYKQEMTARKGRSWFLL
ncbi:hypothetical protein I203_100946 [Kwoniella mangroviensis CBS 8507]|uniref:uncharacterized protein n=1 Tax=Kwoniella mangroviensis CBS 8507 TaxID=1296122 RepID=UPI00080CEAAA|nr:uncharacterized protein I203_02587 [Kwoniella mangroviensis CBS 8507]OCF67929.1 hypothetical protein I203_02587 [Kwoniella mangroviensis CBS 8507]